ncbi:MAG TPA: hypothetical protein VKZ63_21555 [Kofleriaceae bacterium]|nr:hypothetical protein [Kofleriaceae bacterium]
MPIRLAPLLALCALAPLGCAAGVLPPSRTEVGTAVIARGGQPQSGVRVTTGAHLASGQLRRDGSFDVGAGYVFERVQAGGGPGARSLALGSGAPVDEAEPLDHQDSHGLYVEAAHVIQRASAHRSWLGARGELLRQAGPDGERSAAGLYARLAWEVFGSGEGAGAAGDGCGFGAGFMYGTFGLGLFLESGARWTEGEETAFVAIGGLSLRMPLLGGLVVDFCRWC